MKKILLVEDDALLNKTLIYNLISEGYDTVSALNAGTAAELLTQTEYDLVLLDINLPNGSGYDLCRLIKLENPDTLVIFLTANDQIRGYEVGAVDYITKPFSIEALLRKIRALEGLYYIVGTIIGSLILSVMMSLGVMRPVINSLTWFSFDFTVVPLILTYPVLVLLAIVIPLTAYRSMVRESIVVRLRME